MHFFYYPQLLPRTTKLALNDDEHRHAQVLRLKDGETVGLLNGKGLIAIAELTQSKKETLAAITQIHIQPIAQPEIHMAIGLLKKRDSLEWMIEKLVELGAASITLLMTENTERHHLSMDRLERIAIGAIKQSGNPWLPRIEVMSFDQALGAHLEIQNKFIAHCADGKKSPIYKTHSAAVWIGPEGDFSPEEIEHALDAGWQPIGLGPLRLRTETAAISALAALRL